MIDYPNIIMTLEQSKKNNDYIFCVYKRINVRSKLLKGPLKEFLKTSLKAFFKTKTINNKEYIRILKAQALIGRNGITKNKKEGDGKTPSGTYNLGIAFGTQKRENIRLDRAISYIEINDNLYWVDDVNSKYYNKLIEILDTQKDTDKDWQSAEHLIDYPVEYKYAIEIKANHNNVKGKGSAIFLHCSNKKPTSGCIAISKRKMKRVLKLVKKDTIIIIDYPKA